MIFVDLHMGRHKEWRKIAKRERRRRIRTQVAKKRDFELEKDEIATKQRELLQRFEQEQIMLSNKTENYKWMQAEKVAVEQWHKLQEKKQRMLKLYLEEEAKIKLEWELELKKKKEEEERLRKIEEENKQKQEEFMRNLETFLSGDSDEPSKQLLVLRETRPQMEVCPFFSKTACCRFGDNCSRNHQYPAISNVLLAANFFSHFGFDNNFHNNEYETDVMLEYDDSDTYEEFKEFFYDVLSEFEKFGRVVQFKVCSNHEKHLRGNTYVEFENIRNAVSAYRSLHTRWYGGRQLSLEFCTIHSWRRAICGLQMNNRCPKGRVCNFLHVFQNPNNRFLVYDTTPGSEAMRKKDDEYKKRKSSRSSWRWSKSPEPKTPKRRRRSRSRERRYRENRRNRRSRSITPSSNI